MGRTTLANIAAKLRRLAQYADDRRTASRFEFVDHVAVLRTISDELRALASAAQHTRGGDSPEG
jgi:hypothetical protein